MSGTLGSILKDPLKSFFFQKLQFFHSWYFSFQLYYQYIKYVFHDLRRQILLMYQSSSQVLVTYDVVPTFIFILSSIVIAIS